eukprot:386633_1
MVFDDENILQAIAITFASIGGFIYLPLGLYSMYRYYMYRNHLILKKHYSEINLYMVTSSLLCLCFQQLFVLFVGKIFAEKYQVYATIPSLTFAFVTSILFAWRCYMNYYCIKYSNAIDSDEWKQLINPLTTTNNWFILNKSTYGNYKYFYKHILIACCFYISLIVVLRLIFSSEDHETVRLRWLTLMSIPALFTFIVISFIGYIYCKTPKYGDIFYIHSELKYMITVFLVCISSMIVLAIIMYLFHNLTIKIAIRLFMVFYFSTVFIIGILVQTLFVLHKNANWLNIQNINENIDATTLGIEYELTKAKSISSEASPSPRVSKLNQCDMDDVLSDKNGFNSFIFHLRKEFSTEILLSLLELTQFKESILYYYNNEFRNDMDDIINDGSIYDMNDQQKWDITQCIRWPKNSKTFPRSVIVYDKFHEQYERYCVSDNQINYKISQLMVRAFLLQQKYVNQSAPFQINICYETRNKFANIMNDFDDWMLSNGNNVEFKGLNNIKKLKYLYHIFDECMDEMSSLLRNSFLRYKQTILYDEFNKLWTHKLNKRNKKLQLLSYPSTKSIIMSDSDYDSATHEIVQVDKKDSEVLNEIYQSL